MLLFLPRMYHIKKTLKGETETLNKIERIINDDKIISEVGEDSKKRREFMEMINKTYRLLELSKLLRRKMNFIHYMFSDF